VKYSGGKNGPGVYQRLINLMPPHRVYIEPFLGSGAVIRHKRPALVNIGIDINQTCLDRVNDLSNTILKCDDAISFLSKYKFKGDELIYCDPPYLLETRSSIKGRYYEYEFTDWQHKKLLKLLRRLRCMVMISGYDSRIYREMLQDWRVESIRVPLRTGKVAIEYVWLNFPPPLELHDYRYLGTDFRERDRIRRKTSRWLQKLRGMPELERHAIMLAIQGLRGRH
jgi:site-specific DNA-adenine methylase